MEDDGDSLLMLWLKRIVVFDLFGYEYDGMLKVWFVGVLVMIDIEKVVSLICDLGLLLLNVLSINYFYIVG